MSSELQTTGALVVPGDQGRRSRLSSIGPNFKKLVVAIRTGDDAMVESAVVSLSQRSRWLAPLAMLVGAFLMLFQRVKLLFTNWRLSLVQILPAMWIWAAMLDLKAHVLHGREFHVLRGPLLIPIIVAIAAILMLGSHTFRVLAVFLLLVAAVLQTGATSSIKAIKMSAKLAVNRAPAGDDPTAVSPSVPPNA
jgi:hypothetical protein